MLLTADADAAATRTLECLRNIHSLLQKILSQQDRLLHKQNNIMNSLEKVTPDDEVSPYFQQKINNLRNTAATATTDMQQAKEIMRKVFDKLRAMQNDLPIQACETDNEETYILLIEFAQDLCNAMAIDIGQIEEIMHNALDKINEVDEATIRLIRHAARRTDEDSAEHRADPAPLIGTGTGCQTTSIVRRDCTR